MGPGNLYVTLAKQEVAGLVGIDMPAGPSEILVVADETARLDFVAADMLSQAEQPLAAAYCVTTSRQLAEELPAELERQCKGLERQETARLFWRSRGRVLVETLSEAVEIVNLLAPGIWNCWCRIPETAGAGKKCRAVFWGLILRSPLATTGQGRIMFAHGRQAVFSSVLSDVIS